MNEYKQLKRPFFKVFLGAILTYQLLYLGSEKMRTEEIMESRRGELSSLNPQIPAGERSSSYRAPALIFTVSCCCCSSGFNPISSLAACSRTYH